MKTCKCKHCDSVFVPKKMARKFDYCSSKCRGADHYQKTKEHQRCKALQKKFGITLEDYNQMFADQEGHCAICGVHQLDVSLTFAVDHDHKTGEVRGLLCRHCNVGLGHFRDDTTLLAKAIAYLHKE